MILIMITNNWAAGQPTSMNNIRSAAALAKSKEIPFFFNMCGFAENAMFIYNYKEGYSNKYIYEIVQEMFSYIERLTISLEKDGLSNIGGVLCIRDECLLTRQYNGIGIRLKERQILTYRNDSYGGSTYKIYISALFGAINLTDTSERPRSDDGFRRPLRGDKSVISSQSYWAGPAFCTETASVWYLRAFFTGRLCGISRNG